jgi:2-furoyl-CoA dehydrogenase large subunit
MARAAVVQKGLIGMAVRRKEDPRLTTGKGKYIDDLVLPRMLYCSLLRSPYGHARIKRIDASKAEKMPDVVATMTGAEAANLTQPFIQIQPAPADELKDYCMAVEKVRYVGEPVVAVVAETRYAAEDALEQVDVEYEPLPAIVDAEDAMKPNAPLLHENIGTNTIVHVTFDYGNVDKAFKQADKIVKAKLHYHRFSSTPLENNGVIASYDPSIDTFTITSNNQMPMFCIPWLCGAMQMPADKLRLVTVDIGGGFGCKIINFPYMVLMALLSKKTGRPVKWIEERREHLQASSHGNERIFFVEAAVKKDGTILGLRVKSIDDTGAYPRYEPAGCVIWAQVSPGCLRFKNLRQDVYEVVTNKCPVGPNRGYSRAQHLFMLERVIDIVARELGMDPAEIRLKNYIKKTEQPYETPSGCLYDGGDYPGALRKVMRMIDYKGWREKQVELRKQGRYVGIGASVSLDSGTNNFAQIRMINPFMPFSGQSEAAEVRMGPDGRVAVKLGSVPQGQGHETTAAQIVADELGIKWEDIVVLPGFDSVSHPYTLHSGTYASQFAVTGLTAVSGAAKKLREKFVKIAAFHLKSSSSRILLEKSMAYVKGNKKKALPFSAIAPYAYGNEVLLPSGMEPGLFAISIYRPPFKLPNLKTKRGNLTLTYSYQAHAAVVEVDAETGFVKILKYAIVDDCGRPVNPKIVEGQVHGAAAHGIAAALYESYDYDHNGQLLSGTFMDYLPPTSMEAPDLEVEHMITPSMVSPLGTKGLGEGGGTPLPTICNAVEDALSPFEVRLTDSHVTPEIIRTLIDNASKQKQ